jgi:hypothetical protein
MNTRCPHILEWTQFHSMYSSNMHSANLFKDLHNFTYSVRAPTCIPHSQYKDESPFRLFSVNGKFISLNSEKVSKKKFEKNFSSTDRCSL